MLLQRLSQILAPFDLIQVLRKTFKNLSNCVIKKLKNQMIQMTN